MYSYDSYNCDVLCIGGGGAAVTAAMKATNCGADVILVSKEPLGYGDTRISMGMIVNPEMVEGDSTDKLLDDLLRSGEYINDPNLARIMAEKASRAREILESYGHLFQRDSHGSISPEVAFFSGGHSMPRTLGCPPSNGVGIGNALRSIVASSNVKIFEETTAYKLLTYGNHVAGAVCFDLVHGKVIIIKAKTVIIATGGAGWLYYPHTDCTSGATGDGYTLAYGIGAKLVDMEQIQFVPFAITHPLPMCGIFIGDPIMAAPSGVLTNKKGQVVLENINNMTRAEVARVMAFNIASGGGTDHGGLMLDLSPNLSVDEGKKLWERRKKNGQLDAIRMAYGREAYLWKEPWDVAPTAHYTIGGIKVNEKAQSNVPGLYAAGQAMGGVFGADRLGSVSLAEIFVFGEIAGENAANDANEIELPDIPEAKLVADELQSYFRFEGKKSPLVLKRRLQKIMWEKVGIARDEESLNEALTEIKAIQEDCKDIGVPNIKAYNKEILHVIELNNMLECAVMVTHSALCRRETRGAHIRLDYPNQNNDMNFNIVISKMNEHMQLKTEAVKSI